MPIRFTKRRLLALGLMLGLFVVVLLFDWNWLRSPLAAYLSARLGREVTLQGNLEVGLSRQLFLQADDEMLQAAYEAGAWYVYQAITQPSDGIRKRIQMWTEEISHVD